MEELFQSPLMAKFEEMLDAKAETSERRLKAYTQAESMEKGWEEEQLSVSISGKEERENRSGESRLQMLLQRDKQQKLKEEIAERTAFKKTRNESEKVYLQGQLASEKVAKHLAESILIQENDLQTRLKKRLAKSLSSKILTRSSLSSSGDLNQQLRTLEQIPIPIFKEVIFEKDEDH